MSFMEWLRGSEEVETTQEIAELENQVIDSFIKYFNHEIIKIGFSTQEVKKIEITRDLVKLSLQNQDIRNIIADNIYKMETADNKDLTWSAKENAWNKANWIRLKLEWELTALGNNLNKSRKDQTFRKTAAFYDRSGWKQRIEQEGEIEQTETSTTSNTGNTNNIDTNGEESNITVNQTQHQNNEQQQNNINASPVIDYARRFLGKPYMTSIQWYGENVTGLDCSGLISQWLRHMWIIKPHEYLWVPSLCRKNKHLSEGNGHNTVWTTIDTLTGEKFDIKSKKLDQAKSGDWLFWYSQQAQYTRCGGLHHVAMIQDTKKENGITMYKIIESNGAQWVVEKRVNPVTYCAGAGWSIPVIQTPDYASIKNTHNPDQNTQPTLIA